MEHWQEWFYGPCLASNTMKYTTTKNYNDWGDGRDDNEKKTETTMKIMLPDQYLIVQSSIQSQKIGLTEEDFATMTTAIRPRRTIYLPF